MLTPQDITNTTLKSGMGYKKKEVDAFLLEVQKSFLDLSKENEELKEKAAILSEGVQYYKNLEKTLQKSLILAEKTSNETVAAAEAKARAIEQEAKTNANMIISDVQKELNHVHNQIISLVQQYEKYKTQCKQFAATQLELLENTSYSLTIPNLDEYLTNKAKDPIEAEVSIEKKNISFDLKTDLKTNALSGDIAPNSDFKEHDDNENFSLDPKTAHGIENSTSGQIHFSDTQPLSGTKEIFMNSSKKKTEETKSPDTAEKRNTAKDAGFTFSDEEEAAQGSSKEWNKTDTEYANYSDSMEINDVLSKLKKSFK